MDQPRTERRRWPRILGSSLVNVSAAIAAGPAVRLLNLSRGGALLEVAERFPVRSALRLTLTHAGGDGIVIDSYVVWAKVGSIVDGKISYRVAVAFEQPMTGLAVAAAGAHHEERQSAHASSGDSAGSAVAAGGSALPDADAGVPAPAGQTTSGADEHVQAVVSPRDNLARFPSAAARGADEPRFAEASTELVEPRRSMADPDSRPGDVQAEVGAVTAGPARQSTVNQSVAGKPEESGDLQTASRVDPEAGLRRWEEDRSAFLRQMANAVAALQTALDTRALEQSRNLSEQQSRYEALVAELMQTANDQETEHQQVLDEMTAAHDEQRRRADHVEAELALHRNALQLQRAESETLRRELEARLEAAEALCAGHDARVQAVRREAERLMWLCTSPPRNDASQPDETPFARETEEDRRRALA